MEQIAYILYMYSFDFYPGFYLPINHFTCLLNKAGVWAHNIACYLACLRSWIQIPGHMQWKIITWVKSGVGLWVNKPTESMSHMAPGDALNSASAAVRQWAVWSIALSPNRETWLEGCADLVRTVTWCHRGVKPLCKLWGLHFQPLPAAFLGVEPRSSAWYVVAPHWVMMPQPLEKSFTASSCPVFPPFFPLSLPLFFFLYSSFVNLWGGGPNKSLKSRNKYWWPLISGLFIAGALKLVAVSPPSFFSCFLRQAFLLHRLASNFIF